MDTGILPVRTRRGLRGFDMNPEFFVDLMTLMATFNEKAHSARVELCNSRHGPTLAMARRVVSVIVSLCVHSADTRHKNVLTVVKEGVMLDFMRQEWLQSLVLVQDQDHACLWQKQAKLC
jgi:hypothetical protein